MDNFYDYYSNEIDKIGGVKRFIDKKRKNATGYLAKYIINSTRRGDKILEVGAGTGVLSFILAESGRVTTALDNDHRMISILQRILSESENNFALVHDDIWNIEKIFHKDEFILSVSLGVLEHFSKEDIPKVIRKQLAVSRGAVIGVPSINLIKKYKDRGAGDEIFLDYNQWRGILSHPDFMLVDSFGLLFGKSTCKMIPKYFGNYKIFSKIFAKYAAFYCFVIESRTE